MKAFLLSSRTLLGTILCGLLASCAINPLDYSYRSAPGVSKREWRNSNPSLVLPSMSSHDGSVNRYLSKGYQLIGYGSFDARYQIDAQNARLLAMQKNADVAVFSSHYQGEGIERVAVPIAMTTSSRASAYANSCNYQSRYRSAGQQTLYEYRDQRYPVWNYKTTLLRKN